MASCNILPQSRNVAISFMRSWGIYLSFILPLKNCILWALWKNLNIWSTEIITGNQTKLELWNFQSNTDDVELLTTPTEACCREWMAQKFGSEVNISCWNQKHKKYRVTIRTKHDLHYSRNRWTTLNHWPLWRRHEVACGWWIPTEIWHSENLSDRWLDFFFVFHFGAHWEKWHRRRVKRMRISSGKTVWVSDTEVE